jgi:type III secretory pathway component EscT
MKEVLLLCFIQYCLSMLLPIEVGRGPKLILALLLTLIFSGTESIPTCTIEVIANAVAYIAGIVLLLNAIIMVADLTELIRGQFLSAQYDPLLHLEESSLSLLVRYFVSTFFVVSGGIERSFLMIFNSIPHHRMIATIEHFFIVSLSPLLFFLPWCFLFVVIDIVIAVGGHYIRQNAPTGVGLLVKGGVALLFLWRAIAASQYG